MSEENKIIYLDHNASTPIDARVAEAMRPYLFEHFGNPSSSHSFGRLNRMAVEKARGQCARLLGCDLNEIIFTSGGSESNNMAIKGLAYAQRQRGNHIITSCIEHPAVLEVCRFLEQQGFKVTYVDVDEYGRVDPEDIDRAVTSKTILISVMHANNEVGTIQPLKEISQIAHSHHIIMHTDAAQSIGKIKVNVNELDVDLLSLAGHKFYAPKGIGALYIRTGTQIEKMIHGAEHEFNLRAGTENVLEVVGVGEACEMVLENLDNYTNHMAAMRERLEMGIKSTFPWIKVNGHPETRLPNTSSISFRGVEANTIISECTSVAVSAGAACHADRVDVSAVLQAMHIPLEYAMGTIRFSVGRYTSSEDIDQAVDVIRAVVKRLQPTFDKQDSPSNNDKVRLTQFTHGLGCACKLQPDLLEQVLMKIPRPDDERILVGVENSDDAAVFRINENTALVQTVDFFTPIVDDPYQFGAISAANSLSDIYAMGAVPLFALSIVAFPSSRLPISVMHEIMRGAYDKAAEAGIAIIGGHSVDDTEPKFGLAVTGTIHPDRIITNAGACSGDILLLTKPIGTGILTTALKQGLLNNAEIESLVRSMSTLNRDASAAMLIAGAHACTDVTGFGLLGHLLSMMKASNTSANINVDAVPVLGRAYELATGGILPGGTKNNLSFTSMQTSYSNNIPLTMKYLLNDAQTSGGLLISLPEENKMPFINELAKHDQVAAVIGSVLPRQENLIMVGS